MLLASNLYLALGGDEYGAAGALLGEPLRVARCERAAPKLAHYEMDKPSRGGPQSHDPA